MQISLIFINACGLVLTLYRFFLAYGEDICPDDPGCCEKKVNIYKQG